ncbi:MAG: TetR/AcrR family transcriptional regulator [Candidatus Eisenbacteria bacterium]|nr:TetR/AcrR family transcriptional regulator [Candidatus Eisenbacteria bacterium]
MFKRQGKARLAAERKKKILAASMRVFSKYGYQDTEVEDIARLAGLGKGTVYRHFGSKENLFFSTLEWGLTSLADEMNEAVSAAHGYVDKVKTALVTYLLFFEKHRDFYRIIVQDRMRTEIKSSPHRLMKKHMSLINHLTDVLEKGIRDGYFKKIDVESAAHALFGIINSLLYKWLTSRKRYPIRKEVSVIEEIFLSGILSVPQAAQATKKRCKERR